SASSMTFWPRMNSIDCAIRSGGTSNPASAAVPETEAPLVAAIAKLFEVGGNGSVKLRGFGLLLAQRRGKPLHLLVKRLIVLLGRCCADIATWGEHMAVLADIGEHCCITERRRVGVIAGSLTADPGTI